MAANVFTIAAGVPFADALARGLIATLGAETDPLALADATIYLPTRRAVRTLGEIFAQILGGAALLPQMRPLGDIDEDDFVFGEVSGDFATPPAMTPVRRRLLLATLVRQWHRAKHGEDEGLNFAQASLLARALGQFLDEAETQNADLSRLETLAPERLAAHWADVRDFLVHLRDHWPALIAAQTAIEPAARRNLLLDGLAAHYASAKISDPVIAAGTTGSIPATARLLGAIANLPNGAVVLPGLDRALDAGSWDALEPGHPQYGMKELLAQIGVARADVRDWQKTSSGDTARSLLLRETLRPAPTTDAWRAIADSDSSTRMIAEGLKNISLVEAAHPGEEALAIALVLREALEMPKRTAALVTPDRNLARRVAAELGRWNIAIDDSAGKPLANTATGAFLLLLLDALRQDFAPVPFLALLKHPLASGGMALAEFRRAARLLDRHCLRGPRPDPGLAGIRDAIARAPEADRETLVPWFDGITKAFAPLCAAFESQSIAIADIADAHARAAEALAASDTESGADRLWRGDAGEAAAELLAALKTDSRDLPAIEPESYEWLFRSFAEEPAIRPRYGRHPRLAILGPLEARLQSFDVLVLGGLNEGTWPASVAADPWLSRPMRANLGLPSPERAIGLAAHDFAMLAAGPRVYLTRALKADGAPTVASRWVQRLTQLVHGLDLALDETKSYLALAQRLDQPGPYAPEKRPAPTPPVKTRPRSLSVTEIETWLRDPYAIYAKHILKLKPLEPLDASVGPLERGTLVHRILELFLDEWDRAPTEQRFVEIADDVLRKAGTPHTALALWRPRLLKAARWFIGNERERRDFVTRSHLESRGSYRFEGPAGEFHLRVRADRIDELKAGGAGIIDYKTGNPPTVKQVRQLLAPQLPLEGVILAAGGFADIGKLEPTELLYIQFSGSREAGKIVAISGVPELVAESARRMADRVAAFDDEATPYLSRVIPFRKDLTGDYDHLARVREWSAAGAPEEEE